MKRSGKKIAIPVDPINQTVMQMVEEALKRGGFDGLYNNDGGCGCLLGDLSPGDCMSGECEAAHKVSYPDRKCGGSGCDGDCEYHTVPGKPCEEGEEE
jgi:hypothetical protein